MIEKKRLAKSWETCYNELGEGDFHLGNSDDLIIGERCEVFDSFLVKVRKRQMVKQGTIRGYYVNEYWHPYVYKAFHIEFDDGTRDTYLANKVKLIK
jgi:hypothetical protein